MCCPLIMLFTLFLCCPIHRSIIELARSRGYDVEEAPVSVHEAMEADELFTTGTAVVRAATVLFVCLLLPCRACCRVCSAGCMGMVQGQLSIALLHRLAVDCRLLFTAQSNLVSLHASMCDRQYVSIWIDVHSFSMVPSMNSSDLPLNARVDVRRLCAPSAA